jgi:hypothetical protein
LTSTTGGPPRDPRPPDVEGPKAATMSAIELPPNEAMSSASYSTTGGWSTISCPRIRWPETMIVSGPSIASCVASLPCGEACAVSCARAVVLQAMATSDTERTVKVFKA